MTTILIKQSTAVRHIPFLMVLASDHVTGATGLVPVVTLSKNAAGFAAAAGAVTEIANGWYKLAADATDSNTLGTLVLHAAVATADPTDMVAADIVAFDPDDVVRAGLTALPNAVAEAAGGLYTRGAGAGQIAQSANGQVDINVARWLNTAVAAPTTAGVPEVDVTFANGTAIQAAAGRFQVDVELWQGGPPNGLTIGGDLPVDVQTWLGVSPAALTASGYLQTMLLRWMTDNAGGTPGVLVANRVPSDVQTWLSAVPALLTANGYVQSALLRWLTDDAAGTPNVLIAGRVDANALAAGINLTQWLGVTPHALINTFVPAAITMNTPVS